MPVRAAPRVRPRRRQQCLRGRRRARPRATRRAQKRKPRMQRKPGGGATGPKSEAPPRTMGSKMQTVRIAGVAETCTRILGRREPRSRLRSSPYRTPGRPRVRGIATECSGARNHCQRTVARSCRAHGRASVAWLHGGRGRCILRGAPAAHAGGRGRCVSPSMNTYATAGCCTAMVPTMQGPGRLRCGRMLRPQHAERAMP